MADEDTDTLIRMAAFDHARRLGEVHDHLTATELRTTADARIPEDVERRHDPPAWPREGSA
jgi:hypothetical protein